MKIHVWEDADTMPINILENGDVMFYDLPELWNFEVGDQIQYRTRIGTSVYFVVEVTPANLPNYPERMRKIIARGQ